MWRIYKVVISQQDSLNELTVSSIVEPVLAAQRFEELYKRADETFDLGGCDALLEVMRQRELLLDQTLRDLLVAKERYLSSRLLFVDEYYRTRSYFEHGSLLDKFRSLVESSLIGRIREPRWLLDLHGKGGVGKTMFRRWVVARHCLPAASTMRTPVARRYRLPLPRSFVSATLVANISNCRAVAPATSWRTIFQFDGAGGDGFAKPAAESVP
jgi:hypothetical protein